MHESETKTAFFFFPEVGEIPELDLSCHRYIDNVTGESTVAATWSVTGSDHSLEAIAGYSISILVIEVKPQAPIPAFVTHLKFDQVSSKVKK